VLATEMFLLPNLPLFMNFFFIERPLEAPTEGKELRLFSANLRLLS
jgi:hypothetical protein